MKGFGFITGNIFVLRRERISTIATESGKKMVATRGKGRGVGWFEVTLVLHRSEGKPRQVFSGSKSEIWTSDAVRRTHHIFFVHFLRFSLKFQ